LQQRFDQMGPLECTKTLRIGGQIVRGLAAAHEQGLIHRDTKPANILLGSGIEQNVKITDFGLARAADDASISQSGVIGRTPLLMAPAQATGGLPDRRADLFSLGSVLRWRAAGRRSALRLRWPC
jgi:serine/threonine protein kinase